MKKEIKEIILLANKLTIAKKEYGKRVPITK